MFSVLLALVVDEWREDRENRALAGRAIGAVLDELDANREELGVSRENQRAMLALVDSVVGAGDDAPEGSFGVDYELAILSDAAWETAQATQAIHYMDFDQATRLSRLYQLQRVYQASQERVVERIATIDAVTEPLDVARALAARIRVAVSLADGLDEGYRTLLCEAGRREGIDCPEDRGGEEGV